jgi:phosphoribosylaminoimidazolecarboxamide formyltransferase/IMP cyclohydrolase
MAAPRRALISVSRKDGLVDFARDLVGLHFEILSTGGTAKLLREAGLPVTDVSAVTGFPEIMDGRVKTLHPKIHGGLLALRDNPQHREALEKHGIQPIDLVVVNLYPFQETIARPGVTLEEAIENIDIGGPSMVRAAAKNYRFVAIVTDPADYPRVADALRNRNGVLPESLLFELAVKAYRHTAAYDSAISAYLGGLHAAGAAPAAEFPSALTPFLRKTQELRYGENPHQKAAVYTDPLWKGPSVAAAQVHGGKELSYNNLLDLHSALSLAMEFDAPAAVVVKHNNPCGAAVGASLGEAWRRAHEGDTVSAFGGIVAFNRPVDEATAEAVAQPSNFLECIIAPGYAPEALAMLKERTKWGKNCRILATTRWTEEDARRTRWDIRSILGGALVQTADTELMPSDWKVATVPPTAEQARDLKFAWTVCKHVKSNAIVLAKDGMVVGVGAGQMSRVDSSYIAVRKAGDRVKGAVIASDAFFPFPDALEVCLDAGAVAAIQPGGSMRDNDVIAVAQKRNIPMVLTGMRHFRH